MGILGTSRQPRPYKNYLYFLKNLYINYDQIFWNHLSVDILKELSFIAITLGIRFFFIYGGVFIIHIDSKLGYIFNVANIILFYLGVFLCGYLKRWNETIWSFLPSNSRNNLLVSKSILWTGYFWWWLDGKLISTNLHQHIFNSLKL